MHSSRLNRLQRCHAQAHINRELVSVQAVRINSGIRAESYGNALLKTIEYGDWRSDGSYECAEASTRTYGTRRRSSSAKSGLNQSGCS